MRYHWTVFLCILFLFIFALTSAFADDNLSEQRIQADTVYLCETIGSRETGTPAEQAACDWLQAKLAAAGFSQEDGCLFRVPFQGLQGKESENLIAVCNAGAPGPLFSVVAHYDSVANTPGARDNAAAVATLLEIARYLSPSCQALPCEIRLVFAGSEENGYHGARAYVQGLSLEDRQRHAGAFNMDISAASPEDNAVLVAMLLGGINANGLYVEADSLPLLENNVTQALHHAYQALTGDGEIPVFYRGESDHVPFHDQGLEAVNLCWRRVEDGWPCLPDSYHQPSDTPESLDYATAVMTARCILKAIEWLAFRQTN